MKGIKYKGVIFDLDGVLCSTDELHYQSWKKVTDRLGIYFDRSVNERLRGVSRLKSLDIILEGSGKNYSDEEKISIASEKNEIYRSLLEKMTEADCSDEVRNTLNLLHGEGVLLAVGSSSRNAPVILEKIGIRKYFDAVSDGNNITHSKPSPEVFLKAADFIGLLPCDCLVVEDAAAGIEAGASGGFDTAAFGAAYGCEKADYSIEKISDICGIVLKAV